MARMTPEKRAELEAALAEDDAEDDESDEVEVGNPDGSYFKGSYRRAKQLGHIKEPAPGKTAGDKQETGKRFTAGRRVG